ncbi:endonuclease domain-containing protein [Streptomyces laurentii]
MDHRHETGRVRGVLCFNCHSAIGRLGDDPDVLRRAIAYLEGNAWKQTI